MHAVKLLSAMVDDLTFYITQMPLDIALVLRRDGMAQDKCQGRATERPGKPMSVSKLATNLAVDKLVVINERPAGACL